MIEVLYGSPRITPGSIRIPLDPRVSLYSGVPYEMVFYMPNWIPDFVSEVIAKIIEFWKSTVEGLKMLGHYRDGDTLVIQFTKESGKEVKVRGIIGTIVDIITAVNPWLAPFKVFYLLFGMRFTLAGVGLIAGGVITFVVAHGIYKLLALPLFAGGLYLMAKQHTEL